VIALPIPIMSLSISTSNRKMTGYIVVMLKTPKFFGNKWPVCIGPESKEQISVLSRQFSGIETP
jgi:hypothetical protein